MGHGGPRGRVRAQAPLGSVGNPRPTSDTSRENSRWQNRPVIPWLRPSDPFPPLEDALDDPNGLLAAGGAIKPRSPARRLSPRHLPLVERGPAAAVVEPRSAHGPLRARVPQPSRSLAPRLRDASVRGADRHCLRRGDRGLCASRATARRAHGSRDDIRRGLPELCIGAATSTRSSRGATGALAGGLYGVTLGPGVLRRVDVRARDRRLEGRAGATWWPSCERSRCR